MDRVVLGRTGIEVCKNGFGALPIQRLSKEDAVYLIKKAYKGGINYFDTARAYSDSEEKLGEAIEEFKYDIFIATKTASLTIDGFRKDLERSLSLLKRDYIDVYQFHNPPFCPLPGDGSGLYEEMLKAKEEGKIKHIGITSHRLDVANTAILSNLYDTLQFPFCYISGEKEKELVRKCKEKNIGYIAMKGLSGGLLNNSKACYSFMSHYDNVLPIWGIQRERELDEWLSFNNNPPLVDEEIERIIERDKKELGGEFCRACGYCMPCTVGIQINQCARMIQLIRRSPSSTHLNEESREMMFKIKDCIKCGKCLSKCPYSLNIPELLEKNLKDYMDILEGRTMVEVTLDARLV